MIPEPIDINGYGRWWAESITGVSFIIEGQELTFDGAINAYFGALKVQGASNVRVSGYTAFLGPEGVVYHAALVTYWSITQVDYGQALDDYLGNIADQEAAIGFEPEDTVEALEGQFEEEYLDDDA